MFVSLNMFVHLTDKGPPAQMLWTALPPGQAHYCTAVQPASPCAALPVVLQQQTNKKTNTVSGTLNKMRQDFNYNPVPVSFSVRNVTVEDKQDNIWSILLWFY